MARSSINLENHLQQANTWVYRYDGKIYYNNKDVGTAEPFTNRSYIEVIVDRNSGDLTFKHNNKQVFS